MTRRRIASGLLAVLTALGLAGLPATAARADGDPGSDVLSYQSLFVGSDAGMSIAAQLRLGALLTASARAGVPIRVAVIARRDDLGAVTYLWHQPQAYAHFLGYELSLGYPGRLLVVMPGGLGLNWPRHEITAARQALAGISTGISGDTLAGAASAGVRRLAAQAGVTLRPAAIHPPSRATTHRAPAVPTITGYAPTPTPGRAPTATATATGTGDGSTDSDVALVVVLLIVVGGAGVLITRRHGPSRPPRPRPRWGLLQRAHSPARVRVTALIVVMVGAAAITVAGLLTRPGTPGTPDAALAANPDVDPGTILTDRPAPDFTLSDQTGRTVSLRSFRGKVTLLDFNDAECTTLCPLTTTAMLDAKRMLGPAGRDLQLLGVNANPKATSIQDVVSYTELHGLVGQWDFLTGTLPQLKAVWARYHVQASVERGLISHTPALFLIDRQGHERRLYVTQQSYSAVGQLGQVIAQAASALLPGHPAVRSHLSLSPPATVTPGQTVSVPRSGGGRITLGPGRAHLYAFFDTWDQEATSLAGDLDALNAYVASEPASGLPPLTAVDEGAVEPSARALPAFLHGLPERLRYPVAIDASGRVGDGYEVQGEPSLVLVSATGRIVWYDAVNTSRWPTRDALVRQVRAALTPARSGAVTPSALLGSPAPLASLHRQASRVIGSDAQLMARIRALRGYPVVVNVWASWCEPCGAESRELATASEQFGRQVAFLGADTDDEPSNAAAFLRGHPVSYPSYATTPAGLHSLLTGGLAGTPTTIYIDRAGRVVDVHSGQYDAQGSLDADIESYAIAAR